MPLAEGQIPTQIQAETETKWLVIKNMRNVNAIAENQQLEAEAKGLTVIYGADGSGKSGYSRVFKRAGLAISHDILPNANVAGAKMGNAQTTFTVCVNSQIDEFVWQQGRESSKELSALSIFDTRCARACLDSEDDFAYVPYELEVLDGLANITDEELLRKQTLEDSLKEINPKEKAIALGNKVERVEALATRAEVLANALGLVAIAKLKGLVDEYRLKASNLLEKGQSHDGRQ
ncbi:hypothetical protein ACTJKQ_22375 [Acidovorax sp. 22279]|uniref:hypothetical protein n=1 Tax=Acidovorax sp. 22279 TaxID=3453900 RepID=UPI003F872B68